MRNLFIEIPTPCHENWSEMSPVEKGRFCNSCQKNVIDFTKSTDAQIAVYFAQNKNVCGRFRQSQLERELIVAEDKSHNWLLAASGVLAMLSFASMQAQEKPKPQVVLLVGEKLGEVEVAEKPFVSEDTVAIAALTKVISGIVSDSQIAIPGANVTVNETKISVQTDIYGKYQIEAKQGQTLTFSFIGYTDVQVKIGARDTVDVAMSEGGITLGDEIVFSGYAIYHRPNFVKRTYHKIRNWFR
ncbi:carboxypeptidase-like regulatory domain-containing protein [Flavobacterium sp.]|uniref:carboxypeptidase-like regulatory domain-containing protein n=1 Tax=Flavobacterium sp. TaxID=239 RepID=UPI0011FDF7D2|nr:carboxypeptidase-like regulatory domain-containing protein [Flavobacterium sp.]RZJ72943.1 MAG: hypothetical protein EOO49_04750 [Flavobacterium sp.]